MAELKISPAVLVFRHRYPIDGLRAIAVLLVVAFHAGMPGLGNGYVGVDIFFVLSGYLITSLLLRERIARGRISFPAFYARRFRRLVPAALLVLIITALVYRWIASPTDLIANSAGFGFAAVYVANWYFLAQSQDYFVSASSPSPVLHYWSLGVEEQFYVVWPLLLMLLIALVGLRRHRSFGLALTGLSVAFVGLSAWFDLANPVTAYFNTAARAYQLVAGAALAAVLLNQEISKTDSTSRMRIRTGSILLLLSALLLIASLAPGSTLGPWVVGLLGTLACIAFLAAVELHPDAPALRLLASRPARAGGRWSYSTYLWHWPLIVLAGIAVPEFVTAPWQVRLICVIFLSFGLAALTSHVVEQPIARIRLSSQPRIAGALALGVGVSFLAAFLTVTMLRVPEKTRELVALATVGQGDVLEAAPADVSTSDDVTTEESSVGAPSTVLLIGDSHAENWREGLLAAANKYGFRAVVVASQGCPWMDIPAISDRTDELAECDSNLWEPVRAAIRDHQPETAILFSRSVLSRRLLVSGREMRAQDPGWSDIVNAGISARVDEIHSLVPNVVLIDPLPLTKTAMLDCLSTGQPATSCDQPTIEMPGTEVVESIYQRLSEATPGVLRVSMDGAICPNDVCPAMVDNLPTFADNNHLTEVYARKLLPALVQRLEAAGVTIRVAGGSSLSEAMNSAD